MKKLVCFLLLVFMTFYVFAYSYPVNFSELMKQFQEDGQKIEIVIDVKYRGWVIVAQDDYCVFKLDNDDIVIILYSAIKEVSLL